MTIDASTFRHTLGHFASGVTVVSMAHGDELSGLTVSAFCSLSLNPPYILVCIDKTSTTLDLARDTKSFGVSLLSEHQTDLSNHFASKLPDKFSSIPHHIGPLGSPLLDGALATLECRLANELDGGDHIILIGEVMHAKVDEAKSPLLYFTGHYGRFETK